MKSETPSLVHPAPPEGSVRGDVLRAALGELGSRDPEPYWRDVMGRPPPYPPHWCGAFCLWALHRAGLGLSLSWRVGLGFAYRLPLVLVPEPGDVAYFDQFQHHALVMGVEPSGVLWTVDGNQPDVRVRKRSVRAARGFFSIAPLLEGIE